MDREILMRQLVQVEQSVAEGKAFIAEQQRLIVESERDDCHDPGSVSGAAAIARGGPR
jgi:hypothetical protein